MTIQELLNPIGADTRLLKWYCDAPGRYVIGEVVEMNLPLIILNRHGLNIPIAVPFWINLVD